MSKSFFISLLVIELLVAFAVGGQCILRKSQVEAFHAVRENPTEATRAEWNRQAQITRRYHLAFSGILFVVMAVPTCLVYRRFRSPAKRAGGLRGSGAGSRA